MCLMLVQYMHVSDAGPVHDVSDAGPVHDVSNAGPVHACV